MNSFDAKDISFLGAESRPDRVRDSEGDGEKVVRLSECEMATRLRF